MIVSISPIIGKLIVNTLTRLRYSLNWGAIRSTVNESEEALFHVSGDNLADLSTLAGEISSGRLDKLSQFRELETAYTESIGRTRYEILKSRQGAVFEAARRLRKAGAKRKIDRNDLKRSTRPENAYIWDVHFIKFVDEVNLSIEEANLLGIRWQELLEDSGRAKFRDLLVKNLGANRVSRLYDVIAYYSRE